jgi:hypothetical protein
MPQAALPPPPAVLPLDLLHTPTVDACLRRHSSEQAVEISTGARSSATALLAEAGRGGAAGTVNPQPGVCTQIGNPAVSSRHTSSNTVKQDPDAVSSTRTSAWDAAAAAAVAAIDDERHSGQAAAARSPQQPDSPRSYMQAVPLLDQRTSENSIVSGPPNGHGAPQSASPPPAVLLNGALLSTVIQPVSSLEDLQRANLRRSTSSVFARPAGAAAAAAAAAAAGGAGDHSHRGNVVPAGSVSVGDMGIPVGLSPPASPSSKPGAAAAARPGIANAAMSARMSRRGAYPLGKQRAHVCAWFVQTCSSPA